MSKKKLVEKALQAAMDARAERYVADPAQRAENLAKFMSRSRIKNTETGEPVRLYHITPRTDIEALKAGGFDPTISGEATWLSPYPDKQPAFHNVGSRGDEFKEGTNVMPVYANIEQPIVLDTPEMIQWAQQSFAGGSREFPQMMLPAWRKALVDEGYDGIIYGGPKSKEYALHNFEIGQQPLRDEEIISLFGERQLKSATGNAGTFDPNIERLTEADGGAVEREHHADGGEVYQSTGENLIGEEGQINWGDPNAGQDFFRADAEMMRRQRAEEEAARKIDREAVTVSSLPAPGSTEQPSAPVPIGAARESDISPYAVLPLIRQAESSNDPMAQNSMSSAGGLYQFTDATWASALRRMDPVRYGRMTTDQLAALKKGTASIPIQERAARFHLEKDIVPTLEGAKIPVNPATIYLSWFQGPQGAVTAYNAPGSAAVKDLFPNTVGPNAGLRYRGKPYAEWTRDDLVNWANETMTRRVRGRAEGGPVEEKTLTEAMLGSNPELPRGELTMSAPPETSLVQRALHALPSFGSYGRAIGEELNAPRRALDVARQINAQSEGVDPEAAKLAVLGALGYAISPITAAQNVLIRDPLLKAGATMDMAQRGVNVSDAIGLAGAIKAGAKKAVKKGVTEPSALGSGAGTQAQLLGGGYLTSPGLPEDRDGKAIGGFSEIKDEGSAVMRDNFDRGGKKLAKSIKSATDQARKVFPDLANRYPEVAPPVEAVDPKSGKPYLAKTLSEEAKALQLARKIAQERIDRGEYTPYFDPAKRYDVDPTQYPAYEPTITQRRVKPETQEKYDTMLTADDVFARLDDAFKRGMLQKEDAENWYMLGQVEAEFIKEFGEKVGRERFKERIADAMAATTGGADPESNFLMAQYGNVMKEKGSPMPTAAYEFPFPIGGRYVTGNMDQYRKMIMEGQGVTPDNPKRYNFSYNFLGSKAPTIDEQMMGIIRPGVNVPEPGTYGHHEAPVTAAAAREGVDPRYYQEVAWAGAKDAKTKGGFEAAPFINTINESIERTSQVTGLPPSEVVRRGLVRSEMPMYGVAGTAAGTGAMMGTPEEEPKAKGGSIVSKALVLTSKKAKR